MSAASIKKKQTEYDKKMTEEKCIEWSNNNGQINPITDKPIQRLNTPGSIHVLISNACAKRGFKRDFFLKIGNEYMPPDEIFDQASLKELNPKLSIISDVASSSSVASSRPSISSPQDSISKYQKEMEKLDNLLSEPKNKSYQELKKILDSYIRYKDPIYDQDQTKNWINRMQEQKYVDNDTFLNDKNNSVIIYGKKNTGIYLKLIMYAFIYGYNLKKIESLQKHIPKKFIKFLIQLFKKYEHDFTEYPLQYYKGLGNEFRNLYENEFRYSSKDADLTEHIRNVLLKYNKSYRSRLSFHEIYLLQKNQISHATPISDSESKDIVPSSCSDIINNISNPFFKNFKDEMLKICKKYSKIQKSNDDIIININENKAMLNNICDLYIKNISKHFQENLRYSYHYTNQNRDVHMYSNGDQIRGYTTQDRTNVYKLTFNNFNKEEPLKSLFIKWYYFLYLLNEFDDRMNILNMTTNEFYFNLSGFQRVAQDIGGITKDIFSDISYELFDKKIFIKAEVKNANSEKYFLNPNLDLKRDLNIEDEYNHTNIFYRFLGSLLFFFLINNFTLPHKLSSHILYGFFQNNLKLFDKYDFVYFLIRDFNDLSKLLINSMNHVNTENDDTGFTLNTFIKLSDKESVNVSKYNDNKVSNGSEDFKITQKNLEQYIFDLSKSVYNSINHDKMKALYENLQHNIHDLSNNISDNIPDIDYVLKKLKIHIDSIDNKLSPINMKEAIPLLVNNIILNNSYPDEPERSFFDDIKKNLSKLLLDENEKDNQIVSRILKFWTGHYDYKPDIIYKINILRNMDSEFPNAHVCFNVIDVPLYDNSETFVKNLKLAADSTYEYFSLAGAKIKKRKNNIKN